jgi:hypothetical protein
MISKVFGVNESNPVGCREAAIGYEEVSKGLGAILLRGIPPGAFW